MTAAAHEGVVDIRYDLQEHTCRATNARLAPSTYFSQGLISATQGQLSAGVTGQEGGILKSALRREIKSLFWRLSSCPLWNGFVR